MNERQKTQIKLLAYISRNNNNYEILNDWKDTIVKLNNPDEELLQVISQCSIAMLMDCHNNSASQNLFVDLFRMHIEWIYLEQQSQGFDIKQDFFDRLS